MKSNTFLILLSCLLTVGIVSAATVTTDTFGSGENQFSIEFVTISGDTNPTSGYGNVTGEYRMGRLEVSNDQFARFADNNHSFGGTAPANTVTWFEAAKFVNWLNTSTNNPEAYKFNGEVLSLWQDGEDGFNSENPFRNSKAKYFLPTEDEWVKGAYWNGTSLQTYSNLLSTDLISGSPDPTKWNYSQSAGIVPWNVSIGVEELNGTKNMMGNVWEWTETPFNIEIYQSDVKRGLRGGACIFSESYLSSSYRGSFNPYSEGSNVGFRVASVPEPCSLVLLGLGALMLKQRKA